MADCGHCLSRLFILSFRSFRSWASSMSISFASRLSVIIFNTSRRWDHWPWLQSVLGGALLLILGILSWHQANYYTDAETLYRMSIDRNPKSWVAYTNLVCRLLLEKKKILVTAVG